MACNADLVQYIVEQCSGAGEITVKKMMGAKEHFLINDVDDRDYLTAIIKSTIPALPKPKAKKNPQPICPRLLCRQQGRLSGRCHQVLALEEGATGKPSL